MRRRARDDQSEKMVKVDLEFRRAADASQKTVKVDGL